MSNLEAELSPLSTNSTKEASHSEGSTSYSTLLRMALPLVFSSFGVMGMQLFDSLFLSWSSPEALAAAVPASLCCWLVLSLFSGAAGYTHSLVAHYFGSGDNNTVGKILWQGLYFSILSGLFLILLGQFLPRLFIQVGLPGEISRLEGEYVAGFLSAAPVFLASAALSGFFSGRGDNTVLMLAQLASHVLNAGLAYGLILGKLGLPKVGLMGAVWAVVGAQCFLVMVLLSLALSNPRRKAFNIGIPKRFNWALLSQMIKYGGYAGLRGWVELLAWTSFLFFLGRLGSNELTISSLVFRVNGLAYFPCLSIGLAVGALTGQAKGARHSEWATRIVSKGVVLGLTWSSCIAVLFIAFPDSLLSLFSMGQSEWQSAWKVLGHSVLLFAAVFALFEGINQILIQALQGAGDTKWSLFASGILHVLFISALIGANHFGASLSTYWTLAIVLAIGQSLVWWYRCATFTWR